MIIPNVMGARRCLPNENPFYDCLESGLNETFDSNWTLKKGLNASFYNFNVTNYLLIGNANITDTLNATNIYMNGFLVQTETPAFKYSNWSILTDNATIIRLGNTSWIGTALQNDTIQRQAPAWNYANNQSGRESAYFRFVNISDLLSGGSITNIRTTDINTNFLTVNQQLLVIGNITNANITNLNINGSLFPSLNDQFELGNATFKWKSANLSGTVQAGFFSGDGSQLTQILVGQYSNFELSNVSNNTPLQSINELASFNNSLGNYVRDTNASMRNYLENGTFNKSVSLTNYPTISYFSSFWIGLNLSNWLGFISERDANSSIITKTNRTFVLEMLKNESIIRASNITKFLTNNSDIVARSLNLTGGAGSFNFSIGNGTMFWNGSHICIMSC